MTSKEASRMCRSPGSQYQIGRNASHLVGVEEKQQGRGRWTDIPPAVSVGNDTPPQMSARLLHIEESREEVLNLAKRAEYS